MSKIVVNLESETKEQETIVRSAETSTFVKEEPTQKKPNGKKKILGIIGISLGVILLIVAVGGYLYWQSLKPTPQYSLALLVDAARRNDQKALDELIDTDAIIDDFMPQVTEKAVELYGRGLPPATILRMTQIAAPMMPTIKQRARDDVPGFIREKTQPFESYPFWAIAVGAPMYLEIVQEVDKASVKSKIPQHQLELTMKKKGEIWQVVAVRDEALARRIAEKYGQEMISAAKNGSLEKTIKNSGNTSVEDLKKRIEDIFK